MEEMGIIRRLDALGRVVIPREFRKLNRIEVGDPLEIRALEGGEILVKKVDLSAQLKSVGAMAVTVLGEQIDKAVGVCTPQEWLLFSDSGNSLEGCELSETASEAVNAQRKKTVKCSDAGIEDKAKYAVFYPILGDTGVFGALVLFTDSDTTAAEDMLLETVARFSGKSMQKF